MRAVIYCRVSTKEQVSNLSLPTQLRACHEYCDREGFEVAECFEDAGESAKTTDRKAFQRLLDYCRVNKGRVQYVVVYNLTRFSRNAYDHAVIRALLRRLGVSLRSVSEPISEDSVGKLTENMLAAIGQFDNDVKAERTKQGMLAALERGRWTWRAPLGYRNGNTKTGETSLVPDAEQAPLVLRAFELVVSSEQSAREVLEAVTALGLRSKRGRALSPQTFCSLLRNPIYKGLLVVPGFGLTGLRGDFRPIVPELLFERVQARLARREGPRTRCKNHPDFPLRRFVVCDVCSTPLTGSASRGRSKRYPYYHCRRCKGISVRKAELETQFVDLLESLRPKPEFVRLFRAIVLDVWKRRHASAATRHAELERRIFALKNRESLLEEAFVFERRIDAATYDRQRDKLRQDVAVARIDLEGAKLEEIDVEGLLGFAEHVLANAASLWTEAPNDQKQRLQRVLFPEGVRLKDGRIGTALTCLAFTQLQEVPNRESALASPPGFEPGFWP